MGSQLFTVLIADDEASIRNGLCEAINWQSYRATVISTAPDGLAAIAAVRRFRPDLVVIDIKMPGMDGLEVIRQAHDEGIPSRFLILSGYDDFALAQKAIRYGARGYFLKPLHVQEFQDELSRQFMQIMAERRFSGGQESMDALMHASRLFLLNQLVNNELRSRDELERRADSVHLRVPFDKAVLCVVILPLCDEEQKAPALEKIGALLKQETEGLLCEQWIRESQSAVLLMSAAGWPEPNRDPVCHVLEKMRSDHGIRCAAGVGKEVPELIHTPQSYSSAMRAVSYALYELPGDLYDRQVVCRQVPPSVNVSHDTAERALQAIEVGDRQELKQIAEDFVQSLFYVPMPPPDYVRGHCTALMMQVVMQMNTRHKEEGPFPTPAADQVRRIQTVASLKEWLADRMIACCVHYHSMRRQTDPLIEAAKAYIREHLSENIKASDVAACINLSTSYFTTYFKEKGGGNFRDYVLQQKMNYAKELLQSRRMSISEIAYATGYTDYRSFSRAFKNVTNHTPSDYQHPDMEDEET